MAGVLIPIIIGLALLFCFACITRVISYNRIRRKLINLSEGNPITYELVLIFGIERSSTAGSRYFPVSTLTTPSNAGL